MIATKSSDCSMAVILLSVGSKAGLGEGLAEALGEGEGETDEEGESAILSLYRYVPISLRRDYC